MRKEVSRSIVKRPFCIHPAMQVFADLRPSLVLVVRSGSLERRESAIVRYRIDADGRTRVLVV